ncbi:DUF1980 domain-containing protein [Bacillus licheniformis]|nr:DUF1980 domain-containing protein [Bacillus licheniformis]
MNKALKKYKEKQHITLKDDDFLKGMETIYHYPGFYIYMKSSDEKGCNHECGCGHDHDHEKDKPFLQRMFIYFVFFFPLCTGLFLPAATLDSNIVKSKGFTSPLLS